jgi:hypothetical protein
MAGITIHEFECRWWLLQRKPPLSKLPMICERCRQSVFDWLESQALRSAEAGANRRGCG